ncbi:hypothetical protein LOZ12_001601 [Ophidiomyces ophidiicola]|nr:hypothetical protein LOZ62_006809 [Ophidiomyces ophidiicola]KAI2009538.1 hypothetical protein LOZ50_001596 [Ophidiomyces ophidiicola]KAI2042760.1 hypothetical protein LOZ38_006819 [Ophidiomyces ophidiicola]KAI2063809.1 hypothetical protein LOZ37_006700 [Ophidiomyces ophidiicola]KAI2078999.1 hypothetical protein LOZ39_001401 [Ophidiomyces ophidiicola]
MLPAQAHPRSDACGDGAAYPAVHDVEKDGEQQSTEDKTAIHTQEKKGSGVVRFSQSVWRRLAAWGVEVRGVVPIAVEDRTDKRLGNVFLLWFTMSCNLLPVVTGMVGTLSLKLSLRDASLVIVFFNALCTAPPAYLSILGPKTGLRQMIQARYSFGSAKSPPLPPDNHRTNPRCSLYIASIVVLLNLATVSGFTIIDCVIGGQTLSALNSNVSVNVGIVTVAVLSLVISFFGYRVLHQYERYGWIPILAGIVIATGCGGRHLSRQVEARPASAPAVLSFGGLIAGYLGDDGSKRIFTSVYLGLFVPTVPLMVLGAAIGGAVPNVPAWAAAYATGSVGGIFAAMLTGSAGGFGAFVTVLLAFSTLGNIAATIYAITLNFQILLPVLARVPRALFALVFVAIIVPVAVRAASSFVAALENFVGVIAYWSAAFFAIVAVEHVVFRRKRYESYDHAIWNDAAALPSGWSALAAAVLALALAVPCMSQNWFVGPVARTTGDIGFEVAMVASALLYGVLRGIEVKVKGGL